VPNVPSAKKRVRTNKRNELRNKAAKSTMKTAIKKTLAVIEAGKDDVNATVSTTQSLIGRTWRRGVIHKNKMARIQSRLQLLANKAQQSK
jgi:small subunit ribosomal protein S20